MTSFNGLNGWQIAEIRERQICNFLDRFGFSSAKGIAMFVYSDLAYKDGLRSASRAIKRLEQKGLILKRQGYDGVNNYVNTLAGGRLGKNPRIIEDWSGVELSTLQNVRQEKIIEKMSEYKKQGYTCVGQIGINRNFKEYAGAHALAVKGAKRIAVFYVANSHDSKIEYIAKWYKTHKIDEVNLIANEGSDAVKNSLRKLNAWYAAEKAKLRQRADLDKALKLDENRALVGRH